MTPIDSPVNEHRPVLVTGATGYVAGRLVPLLLASGYRVRTMGRSIEKMAGRSWGHHPNVELVKGDIMDANSLNKAVAGCGTLYYLVHSMISQKDQYRNADQTGARNMVMAAASGKSDQIIYLGGLGDITHNNITLLSRFLPKGLPGIAYWYILYPFHQYVFTQMLKGMASSTGLTLASPPERFTPKISRSCTLKDT